MATDTDTTDKNRGRGQRPEPVPALRRLKNYLLAPCDPSLLGYLRIAYGCLMTFDLLMERGMSHMDQRFGDSNDDCGFPLIHGLEKLPYIWMVVIHLVMAWSIICITLGLFYRFHCLIYMIGYWYLFLLDKSRWNNHSYLFGLFSIIFFYADAHSYCSLDGKLFKNLKNRHVPRIQYLIPRLQIFLLYFYAALKKTDSDWLAGYSMGNLGKAWPFDPLRWMGLSTEFINHYVVHISGFFIDLTSPFLLLSDKTRPIGFIVMISFHGMNSQLFNIGMFPYTCLATMFIFNHYDCFRNLLGDKSECLKNEKWCYYEEDDEMIDEKSTDKKTDQEVTKTVPNPKKAQNQGLKYAIYLSIGLLYMAIQLFLPYSHFITKGYNGWTQGTYGYSWDMMIHSFATQHTKIYYKDPQTGQDGYLRTDSYTSGRASSRWTSHPDAAYQYATCLNQRLRTLLNKKPEDPDLEIYIDSWKSMNKRFHQRTYDPNVDIVQSNWRPFEKPSYTLPLMYALDDMRNTIKEKTKDVAMEDQFTEVTFIADFPGLFLENFLHEDFKNTTITLIQGDVTVEFPDDEERAAEKLKEGEALYLPPNQFHNVHTNGDSPSCYMYVYENNTYRDFINEWNSFKNEWSELSLDAQDGFVPANDRQTQFIEDLRNQAEQDELAKSFNSTSFVTKSKDKVLRTLEKRMGVLRRTYLISKHAIMVHFLNMEGTFQDWLDLNQLDLYFPDSWFGEAQQKHRPRRREKHEQYLEKRHEAFIAQWKESLEANETPVDDRTGAKTEL